MLLQIVEGNHPLQFKLGERNKKKSVEVCLKYGELLIILKIGYFQVAEFLSVSKQVWKMV